MSAAATSIGGFLRWWAATLKDCVPGPLKNWESWWPRLQFAPDATGYRIELVAFGAADLLRSKASSETIWGRCHRAATLALRVVATRKLALPEEQVLRTVLDLPSAAKAYLRDAVRYQIALRLPFKEADIWFDCVDAQEAVEGSLRVDVRVCSAQSLQPHLSHLASAGHKVEEVGVLGLPSLTLRPALSATDSQHNSLRLNLLCCSLVALLTLSFSAVAQHRLGREAQAWNDVVQSLRQEISAGISLTQKLRQAHEQQSLAFETRKRTVPSFAVLVALGKALPPNAWLAGLDLSEDTVSFDTFAPDSTALLQAIEDAEEFAEARFTAPATRDRSHSYEHVHMAARLIARDIR